MALTIATWNVNSVKARLGHLLDWLDAAAPDVVLLQETKTVDEDFPRLELESKGWHLALRGQKTYNGVAVLSRQPILSEVRSLDGDAGEARYIRSDTVTAHLAPVLAQCDLIVGTEEELHVAGGSEDTLEAIRAIRAKRFARALPTCPKIGALRGFLSGLPFVIILPSRFCRD